MKKEMERMKDSKMKLMIKSDCKIKDYVTNGKLYEVQKATRNYPGHNEYARTEGRCQACPLLVREDQDHLSRCPGCSDLLDHLDLGLDADIGEFYKRVMIRREELWD